MRKLIGGMVVLVVVALVGVGTGSALAHPTVKLEVGGVLLSPGAPILVTSSDFKITGVTCPGTSLTGTVETNSQPTADTLELTAAEFNGEPCVSLLAPPLNEVIVSAATLPWRLTFSKKGEAVLKVELLFKISPTEIPSGGHEALSCLYEAKFFKFGVFPLNGEPLVATFTHDKMSAEADSSHKCSKRAYASGSFAVTSGGSPVVATVG